MESIDNNVNFSDLQIDFKTALKLYPDSGNLVYEYNPFRNYRLNEDMFDYSGLFYTKEELAEELGYKDWDTLVQKINDGTEENPVYNWYNIIPKTNTIPQLHLKGELVDFTTKELSFDINYPVSILPSYSYDNSVDLIINDGKNQPRLINSRFSATERNKYEIIDREGNNDTNIYDRGPEFDVDTSLYKKITTIPKLSLTDVSGGGNLPIGAYTFYFKYIDDDGNESDFFAESGLIQIFIGNSPSSIYSGFRNENSHKSVTFTLSNLDKGYLKIVVYYTKTTSDIHENATTSAHRINNYFIINNLSLLKIHITGYEDSTEVSTLDINELLQRYQAVETLDICLNMLFFAHNYKIRRDRNELKDLALRFLPYPDTSKTYTPLNSKYNQTSTDNYYNPVFSYKYTGYWSDIYRFGIVFIYSDNTLSEVYNTRGGCNINDNSEYTDIKFEENGTRIYITHDESNYSITNGNNSQNKSKANVDLENCKGVIKFPDVGHLDIIGITFKTTNEVLSLLKKLGIKGFFFVRQKRIPTILCQAYTIGIDNLSNVPALPYSSNLATVEGFLNKNQILEHNISGRINEITNELIRKQGAICPEYDVNSPYFNSLFTGGEFVIEPYEGLEFDTSKSNEYNVIKDFREVEGNSYTVNILGVEDNVKLVAIGSNKFAARAGEAEEAFRYAYIGKENKVTECTNLVRGSFGPYLGIVGYEEMGKLINIRIPGYTESDMDKYFQMRYNDPFPYYAISEYYDLYDEYSFSENEDWTSDTLYRGDCFICNYTHRLNRNFQDPSAPLNDEIVDTYCWKNNYEVSDNVVKKENFDKINLGDVNAVRMGRYVHLVIRSNMNLNIRALDDSIPDEMGLSGHPRTFCPHISTSTEGPYKTPEALCYNKGFEKSVSEKAYFALEDAPYYKEDFTNRISYSNIKITDSFLNGFRVFKGTNYRDYPKTYGSITKIIESNGSLICVLEHGIYKIAVNERAVAAQGEGGMAYINTSNVLPENPDVLSDAYGSQWRDSVIKTPSGIYGVDTVGKKIWKVTESGFAIISDFKVGKFLIDNISLSERELTPIIGIRNVKTHYNRYKGDIMFTFYDNLYGFEEKVWNLCYNENLEKWITFYSWVPSYSENIYSSYFSFDRNTSKWIAKLGVSATNSSFADGVTLDNNYISTNQADNGYYKVGKLALSNRELPTGTNISNKIIYTLERDNFLNYKNFKIIDDTLYSTISPIELYSQFYWRKCTNVTTWMLGFDMNGNEIMVPATITSVNCVVTNPTNILVVNNIKYVGATLLKNKYLANETNPKDDFYIKYTDYIDGSIYKNSLGRRVWLDNEKQVNSDSPVILLNIRAHITTTTTGNTDLEEAIVTGMANKSETDSGYYDSVVAVTTKYNMQYLTTDFWKHGQAGIIDIADKIYPTYWYGKLHPFEFEFIVSNDIDSHKIFDNLEIISNNAEPESFHYEIIGDSYDFAKDKENMYVRQEASKHLWQYNGSNVTYNSDYLTGYLEHRKIEGSENYDKSTILPGFYERLDTINEIEDYYHGINGSSESKDFSNRSGGEITYYPDLQEYRIVNHAKAVDMRKSGRLRGNMQYKEDKWYVLINPLNIVECNEPDWSNSLLDGTGNSELVPVTLDAITNLRPSDLKDISNVDIPEDWGDRGIVKWSSNKVRKLEAKLKDKFIKIRVRYSGEKPAIIFSLKTLYSISYC